MDHIKAEDSIAIYIVPDTITSSLREEEDSVLLSAISVSRYLDLKTSKYLIERSTTTVSCSYCNNKEDCLCCKKSEARAFAGISSRPRTMTTLTNNNRSQPLLENSGIDVNLCLKELKYTLLGFGYV